MNAVAIDSVAVPARSVWRVLGLLLFATLLLRCALVFAPPDDLFEKGQVNQEELLRGIAASELLAGPVAPILEYQVNHFWGGSLVASFVAVPFFAVMGPRIVALRMVGVLFALMSVYFAFKLLDRFVSRRAAIVGALLLALPPPGYAYLTCNVFGTHMESNALALGLVWLYFDWRARGRGGPLRTICLGLASGFALWFGYGLLLVLLPFVLFEWADDAWFFLRKSSAFLALGFLVGFAPWIAYGFQRGFRGLDVYDAGIFEHFVTGVTQGTPVDLHGLVLNTPIEKASVLWTTDFPESLWFQRSLGIESLDIGRAVELALLAVALFVLWRARGELWRVFRASTSGRAFGALPSVGAFALVYCALYLVAYVTSDFAIGPRGFVLNFRYLMPLWPFLALVVGAGVARMIEMRGLVRAAGIAGVALLCGFSTVSALDRCQPAKIAQNWETSGTSEKWFARFLLGHFGTDAKAMTSVVARIEEKRTPEFQASIFRMLGIGLRTFSAGPAADSKERARKLLYRHTLAALEARARPEHRALFAPPDPPDPPEQH